MSDQNSAAPRSPRVRASELVGRGWLNTGGKELSLKQLRGKVVVLDFWTFCCINCLHVLEELRPIEEEFSDTLVTIGVHSPKFVHEADPDALAAAVERYEVNHPVLDDPELVTWQEYTARAWPTLVVIDPEGYVVSHMAGEGHAQNLRILVSELVTEHDAKGTLHRGDGPFVPPEPAATSLRFPGKAIPLPNGHLLVSDSSRHSLVELQSDGETVVRRIGSGKRGFKDGDASVAQFSEPGGLTLLPPHRASEVGYDLVVADTVNHALRGVNLADGTVQTLAGTGRQLMMNEEPGENLSSPWDVVWSPTTNDVVVAMAGVHQLWRFDIESSTCVPLAGTMAEGLVDGPLAESWFAQPSGLAVDRDGRVWVADSETSALRFIEFDPENPGQGTVHSAIGEGLFDFGFRDGPAAEAMMQHPLGVSALPDGSVAIADTYNGAVRRFDPNTKIVTTLAQDLAEPSDIVVVPGPNDDVPPQLLVVESAAHRVVRIQIPKEAREVDGGVHQSQRPASDIASGEVSIDVVFTPATGQKLDDRFGPSTTLRVSSTPPELLVEGAGDGQDLHRDIVIAGPESGITEGVLHVTAHAASCDADPDIEFPACHMNQQDWGVPVRIVEGADNVLRLPLHG